MRGPGTVGLVLLLLAVHTVPSVAETALSEDHFVTIQVLSISGAPRPAWPVVVNVRDVSLPQDANLTSLRVVDSAGRPLPSQLDDTDYSGGPSQGDAFCFALDLPPASATPLQVHFDTSDTLHHRDKTPALPTKAGEIVGHDYAITWTTQEVDGAVVNGPAQYRFDSPDGAVFFDMQPGAGEETVGVEAGPVRTVWRSRAAVEEDAVLTCTLECYPEFMRLVAKLAPRDDLSKAPIRSSPGWGVGAWAFMWRTPILDQVQALRWHDEEGRHEDVSGGLTDMFTISPMSAPRFQMELADHALAVFLDCANDYAPGGFAIGQHRYFADQVTFGWRNPVYVWADAPEVTRVTVTRHSTGTLAFRRAEEHFVSQPIVLAGDAVQTWIASQGTLASRLRDVLDVADGRPTSGELYSDPHSLEDAARLRRRIRDFDFAALARAVDAQRRASIDRLRAAQVETTPARALLRRMQPLIAAAKADWEVGRIDRAVARLAEAVALRSRAVQVMKNAPLVELTDDVAPGPIIPHVAVSGYGANNLMSRLGFTVSHHWLPWADDWDPAAQAMPDDDLRGVDAQIAAVNEAGITALPLINFQPPAEVSERHKADGEFFIDPELLGYVPPALQDFHRWIEVASTRFQRADRILAWSLHNEPAYVPPGPVKGRLMLAAMRNWLSHKYGDIESLNEVWVRNYTSFDEVESPTSREEEPAAWNDMAVFKAEALAGELAWEADVLQKSVGPVPVGAKFVPVVLGPAGVRVGLGPDPWTGAPSQRGVALCDLYTDDDWEAYRLGSELWFATGDPVISVETDVVSLPEGRRHRWIRFPDERQRAFCWSAFQLAIYGIQFWNWTGAEEYAFVSWDGTVPDDTIVIAMANQERLALGDLLSTLKPVTHVGLYYPQATFINAPSSENMGRKYAQTFRALTEQGYQVRNFSFRDIDRALEEVDAVVLPPAPYIEAPVPAKLRIFVSDGGRLLALGTPALYDQHGIQLNAGA